jgi:hypothetical protein
LFHWQVEALTSWQVPVIAPLGAMHRAGGRQPALGALAPPLGTVHGSPSPARTTQYPSCPWLAPSQLPEVQPTTVPAEVSYPQAWPAPAYVV